MAATTAESINTDTYLAIACFLTRCASLVDDDKLEDLLEMFDQRATYKVLPLENLKQGLPSALLRCSSRDMLRDRIIALRKANEINIHTDRHILSLPVVEPADRRGTYRAKTSFSCYQTDQEGITSLFAVGYYDDVIDLSGGSPRFIERTVVLETFSIPSLIAVPL
jgi:3-phenylpropionate/cinnamic acid dioxygenase small subunit